MKNLELESMGVQEMDAKEMRSVDGGVHPVLVIAFTYIILEAALNPKASADAFKEGQEMYRQEHPE